MLCEATIVGGRYRLQRRLASGGMGEVWQATHEVVRSEVAIKFLHGALVDDIDLAASVLERFRFEAQISARIAPMTRHVVAVFDAGIDERIPYLVMELVKGRSLDEVLAAGPLTPAQVRPILRQVGVALRTSHQLGIIHRDLKPSNILLADTPDGLMVKLCDFGVAKATRPTTRLDLPRVTALGAVVGSPRYISPEQVLGQPLSPASDVWSLGAVVYEALTGAPCIQGATAMALLLATSNGEHLRLRQRAPHLPRALDDWMERCLAVAPEDRFATVEEMVGAFEAALSEPRPRSRAFPAIGVLLLSFTAFLLITALRSLEPTSAPALAPAASGLSAIAGLDAADAPERPASDSATAPAAPGSAAPPSPPAPPDRPAPAPPPRGAAAVQVQAPPPPSTTSAASPPFAPPPAAPPRKPRAVDPSEIH